MAHYQRSQGPRLTSRSRALAAFCVLALAAACSTEPKPIMVGEPNVPPANYRADVLAYLRTYLNDPTGVREAYISEPVLRNVGSSMESGITQRFILCVRYNAKNSLGKYEGSRDRVVAFLAGQFDTMVPARGDQCKDAAWQPFPELEKLRR
jgi:hypothetical protein